MMKSQTLLSIKDLSIAFKSRRSMNQVIKNISLEIPRASIFAIVGESGSGKSVTANSIMQLLPPTAKLLSGSINYNQAGHKIDLTQLGRYSPEMRSIRGKEIAMIFQNPISSLNPVYRIGDQIIEAIKEHDSQISDEEARQRAIDMLDRLGITRPHERVDQYPHEFSGGMAQRVMIAMAMINNPNLLIADEPTTALDVTVQADIMQLLRQMRDQDNKSIILITHNMGLVAENADQVAVMFKGRIVETGPVAAIFSQPQHPYTKGLLNSVMFPGMNKDRQLSTLADYVGEDYADRFMALNDNDFLWYQVSDDHWVLKERRG